MPATVWTIQAPPNEIALEKIYLYLYSGEVVEVADVREIALTDTHLILTSGNGEAVVFDRRDVYYSCCQRNAAPPAY